ncbi:MAG: bifunctional homocysteine S-methyltransferase/methylenetetrahydrofolate reductase [Spirochaetaceae bacterium 4572_59]|nr:MAG: bifunctional homocysteine S-methyltransferase/methylenetetrahydrofolate reductase [Spirochaetaceae bacterium 4572_59]
MKSILEKIKEQPLVFDGAMGTMLYSKGVFINRCYDELNLTSPDLVGEIHQEYRNAGADVLETNSFGANRIKLSEHGLGEKVREINVAAAKLARQYAGDKLYVAGSMGPCLKSGQILTDDRKEELAGVYREQAEALKEGGVDMILLETFSHGSELLLAAQAVSITGLPVCASFTLTEEGYTPAGESLETVISKLNESENVQMIGLNCGTGPSHLYEWVVKGIAYTKKPLIVMPNAGFPKELDGRMIYLSNPEYFTKYTRKFMELGVRAIGGCCGTTPDHIKIASRAVKALSVVKKHIKIKAIIQEDENFQPVPQEEKSRLACLLKQGIKVTSVEITPPRSTDLTAFINKARICAYHGVDAINIPDGPRASARVSPMIAASVIQKEAGIEAVLHYTCRDRNLLGMQSDILGSVAAGLKNFLVITGDPPKSGDYPEVTGVFDVDSIGLTRVVHNMNYGHDFGGNPIKPPTSIFTGVGANPCAVSPELELDRYRRKIEAGAEYSITQPVFDPMALLNFMEKASAFKEIPVIAGVWPLVSFKNAEFMRNEVPGVEVPDSVMERMSRCQTREEGISEGIRIATEICETIEKHVQGFQVSAPFGKVELALKVLGKTV